ncbi:MAG: RpiB/LacA/LacB family sugar-phosphate isomerase [Candidatus Yanofskybacteria bacterium]|nr:RpiB/LacA/LacB family sugar-phosphate isomerase [Candidatus Yanofskybacteria bacterium]
MIYLGADHRGYELKEKIKQWLDEFGYTHEDLGALEYNKDDDYPDFSTAVAAAVALSLSKGQSSRGILVCGSGIGIAVAANKIKGVRAGTATNAEQVRASVNDEDLNVLALSADYTEEDVAKEIIKTFLETKFSGEERHVRRLNKIEELEK